MRQKIISAFATVICLILVGVAFFGNSVSLGMKKLMATAAVVILSAYILYILKSNKVRGNRNERKAEIQKVFDDNIDWLQKRWDRVQKEKDLDVLKTVDWWYFDTATEQQLSRIKRIGLDLGDRKITAGQATDIIGLYEPVEEKNETVLKNRSIPLNGMNQTKARENVSTLLTDLVETRQGTANIVEHLIIKELPDDFIHFAGFFNSRIRQNNMSPEYIPKDSGNRIRYEQAALLGLASKGIEISTEEKLKTLKLDQINSLVKGRDFSSRAHAIETLMGNPKIVDRFNSAAPTENWFQLKNVKLDVNYLKRKWSELHGDDYQRQADS